MQKFGIIAAMLLCVTAVGAAEGYVDALKDGNVGDWVEYKSTVSAKGRDMEMTQKRKITAKDDKSITIKTDMTVMGHAIPGHEIVLPLDHPYNPAINDPNAKFEKTEEGDEKLTINGKEYDTHFFHYKGTTKNGTPVDGKVWLAKGIALGGMVKMEGSTERGNMTMELTGSGHE